MLSIYKCLDLHIFRQGKLSSNYYYVNIGCLMRYIQCSWNPRQDKLGTSGIQPSHKRNRYYFLKCIPPNRNSKYQQFCRLHNQLYYKPHNLDYNKCMMKHTCYRCRQSGTNHSCSHYRTHSSHCRQYRDLHIGSKCLVLCTSRSLSLNMAHTCFGRERTYSSRFDNYLLFGIADNWVHYIKHKHPSIKCIRCCRWCRNYLLRKAGSQ